MLRPQNQWVGYTQHETAWTLGRAIALLSVGVTTWSSVKAVSIIQGYSKLLSGF